MAEKKLTDTALPETDEGTPKVVWNDAKMQTTYANV